MRLVKEILFYSTLLTNLIALIYYLSIKTKRGEIRLLGYLVFFSLLFDTLMRLLAKYGLPMINFLGNALNISPRVIINSVGFYIVQEKYVANVFLTNTYSMIELSFILAILLSLQEYKTQVIVAVIILTDMVIISIHAKYFLPSNIEVSTSLTLIESSIILLYAIWTFFSLLIIQKKTLKKYIVEMIFGIILFGIVNFGYLVYQNTAPYLSLYFMTFFSIVGNLVFLFVFVGYKAEA